MTAKAKEAAKLGERAQDLVVVSALKSWTCAELRHRRPPDYGRRGTLRHYPGCPEDRAEEIAHHAFTRGSGRVGRSAAGRDLDPEALNLAVAAAVRHVDTRYEELLMDGMNRLEARARVRAEVEQVMAGKSHRPGSAEISPRSRIGHSTIPGECANKRLHSFQVRAARRQHDRRELTAFPGRVGRGFGLRIGLQARNRRIDSSVIANENRRHAGEVGMARAGIEPATPRFSVVCSTN
jgi:hypothetical protein